MYICEWKATYIMIKHDFWATEKIIFNGMLERNDLNYQPMTDMTQCASELNQTEFLRNTGSSRHNLTAEETLRAH